MTNEDCHSVKYVKPICFCDESTFYLNGNVNTVISEWTQKMSYFVKKIYSFYQKMLQNTTESLIIEILEGIFEQVRQELSNRMCYC